MVVEKQPVCNAVFGRGGNYHKLKFTTRKYIIGFTFSKCIMIVFTTC